MTTETAMDVARSELFAAIGLSQAQFASSGGDGLDSAALVAAVDAFEQFIRSESDDLFTAAVRAREAFRLTREYVGEETLPAIEGWSWYDADQALEAAIEQAKK